MLFTVGTSYFIFINSGNLLYVQSLSSRTTGVQDSLYETATVTAILQSTHIQFYANNTGSSPLNVTAAYVLDSSGNVLKCLGVGIPTGSSCYFSTTALSTGVNPGKGSATVDTGYVYVSGTDTVKIITAKGNTFSATYPQTLPNYAVQAQSSGSLTVDMSTFRWFKPTGDTQAGNNVGGYPAISLKAGQNVVFKVTFTNRDAQNRVVTLWPQSSISVLAIKQGSTADVTQSLYYIIDSINNPLTSLTAYNSSATRPMITLAMNTPVALYFGADTPLGSSINSVPNSPNTPFAAIFTLVGQYSDKTLYGQTIPYPSGVVTGASASLSAYSGANSATITPSCGTGCGLKTNRIAFIGWIDSTNSVTVLTKFTTDGSGNIPSGTTFTVPTASAGYYTIMVSDYSNSVFFTFNHT